MTTIKRLSSVPSGKNVRLVGINSIEEQKIRLAEMGLLEDTTLTILRNEGYSPILVECRFSKIMIGRKLSQQIEVMEDNHVEINFNEQNGK